jgi:predicted acylesterase/phospholipase RssA
MNREEAALARPSFMPLRRSVLRVAACSFVAAMLPGCATPERGPPVPHGRVKKASVLGVQNERYFPALGVEPLEREFFQAMERHRIARGLKTLDQLPHLHFLAVSGGGENGAFGAGLLCGWTEHGSRPPFNLVTGISTGALTAPFAFLGSAYDAQLRAVYTDITPSEVLIPRGKMAALYDDALADNTPLFHTISRHLNEQMILAIAKEYDVGRLLLIGTTDLDAQLGVIWNVGAIAKSGHPRALDTIRRILLASAAVPGAFPPTMIDVTVDGKTYQEMHVDGGAFAQTFLYPIALTTDRRRRLTAHQRVIPVDAYIIRNGRLHPEWAAVERRTLAIAARAISTLTTASGYNDVVRIYNQAKADDVGYNLAFIGPDFAVPLPASFDQDFMRALFDYGYQRGRRGYEWSSRPPRIV